MGAASKGDQTLKLRKSLVNDDLPQIKGDKKAEATGNGFVTFGSEVIPNRRFRISWRNTKILGKVVKRALTYKDPNIKNDPWYFDIRFISILFILGKVGYEFAGYFNGTLFSEFLPPLISEDKPKFIKVVIKGILLALLIAFILALNNLLAGIVQAKSRRSLTYYTDEKYIKKNIMYDVVQGKRVDNPDQRITQDIDKLSASFMVVIARIIVAPAVIIYYTVRTWLITGYYGPVSMYVYFLVGTLIGMIFIPFAASKVYFQEKAEGYFRNQYIALRDEAEEIALMGAEKKLQTESDRYMRVLYALQRRVVQFGFPLVWYSEFFNLFAIPLSYAILGIPIFGGKYDYMGPAELASITSKTAYIAIYLAQALTDIFFIAGDFSKVQGYAVRISQLWDEIDRLEIANADREIQRSTDGSIELSDVTVVTPSNETLVSNLSFKVIPGSNLLITGPNGYVRVPYNGDNVDMYTLPQKTLIVNGSLVEQVIFPLELENVIDREDVSQRVIDALRIVGLSHTLKREFHEKIIINDGQYYHNQTGYDDDSNINLRYSSATWDEVLSPGEVQKLALSRVFYANPKYAILDEATSSLDLTTERQIYSQLVNRGITVISIGHRESLTEFHKNILNMDGRGGFSFSGN
ncbi:hypothetical protein BB560_003354 [Smittium megazygosporum]|uniref:ABC transmembrane type-1 domain-containing protein n=1 Tax=Smittium megazygosporum TaxID=133381 RepID=A0A2T9ZC72_9FUNG|nr:hypothetical protein BB560_003354 [Smittium megazygosporum]